MRRCERLKDALRFVARLETLDCLAVARNGGFSSVGSIKQANIAFSGIHRRV
jgi:hypothetical protein